ncbi:MAG TPA: sigma factor-like helix-turn-helix DNA-binding protein [Microthrixaceae bacterium]|nr:sigma factor-like helix-turn-helix DNA-binding protein [Microthrixaceae bacterium]
MDLHGTAVQSVLRGLELDSAVREELWADVFEIACRRIDDLQEFSPEQQRRWLLRTARNLTANVARRAMARRRMVERLSREPLESGVSAEDAYFEVLSSLPDQGQVDLVRQAWEHLSADHREVLGMDALGHKGPAIAEQLGVSPEAARSRLMRARQAFGDAFKRANEALA